MPRAAWALAVLLVATKGVGPAIAQLAPLRAQRRSAPGKGGN